MTSSDLILKIEQLYGPALVSGRDDYELRALSKSDYIENDIYTVHLEKTDSDNRLGWLIPFNALSSKEHKCSDNPHFENYVRVAAAFLKNGNQDLYDEDNHFLILNKKRLRSLDIDSVEQLVASIRKYGYQWGENNKDVYRNPLLVSPRDKETEPDKLIVVKSVNIQSIDDKYFFKLFYDYMPNQKDLYARFLLIYQCIELLVESQFVESVNQLIKKKNSLGSIREEISKKSKERSLINDLFSRAGLNKKLDSEELDLIKEMFGEHRSENYYSELLSAGMIYDIRNALVHSYHKYDLDHIFHKLVDKLEYYIVRLVEKIVRMGGFDMNVIGTR